MKSALDAICLRTLTTIFMFVGVVLVLIPLFRENRSNVLTYMAVGGGLAAGCGMLRCYFDGECNKCPDQKRKQH